MYRKNFIDYKIIQIHEKLDRFEYFFILALWFLSAFNNIVLYIKFCVC